MVPRPSSRITRRRKTTPAPCPRCDHICTEMGSTSAIGLFSAWPTRYRARFEGSPLRDTRAEAHQDMCRHRVEGDRR